MPKTLVVCCDGTWNKPDQAGAPTNVTKMARAIEATDADGNPQIVHYDQGVGTGDVQDRILGGMFGVGLGDNVQEAYRFLALNWAPGDRIVLFGFSRGAYTVRSLAGLIGAVGLLHKGDLADMPRIWAYYRTPKAKRDTAALADLPRLQQRQPDIDLLGVWDTVGAMGIPGNVLNRFTRHRHEFHDVVLGPKVLRAYQALAVDEERKNFAPAIWDTSQVTSRQQVEQVWFAGGHSNVGGGFADANLSDIAFLWMVEKARPLLAFDEEYLQRRARAMTRDTVCGVLVNMATGRGWRLLPRYSRPIGTDRTETVHPSVEWRLRYENKGAAAAPFDPFPYQPANLLRYLARLGSGASANE